jgi:hypothetical protein
LECAYEAPQNHRGPEYGHRNKNCRNGILQREYEKCFERGIEVFITLKKSNLTVQE